MWFVAQNSLLKFFISMEKKNGGNTSGTKQLLRFYSVSPYCGIN